MRPVLRGDFFIDLGKCFLHLMFSFKNISTYHKQLLSGETSCIEAVEFYLKNIEHNKHLNAFTEVYAKEAKDKAKQLDALRLAGQPLKKMHGVVIAIKDVICYKGHKVTAASKILKGFESLYTATALQYLIDEDAIIIGNSNCDEFAMGSTNENSAYGPVLNAKDTSKVPGGSSGGSAVAVQAAMCMAALGSDTGGSVRQPADFCGIVGMKPSYGRISRYGLLAYASSFDQIGIFATNVEDIAWLLQIMAMPDKMDSTMLQTNPGNFTALSPEDKKFKFCYFPETLAHKGLDAEIKAKFEEKVLALKAEGHQVEEVHFDLLDYIVPAYYVLTTAEASSNLSRYDGLRFGHQTANPEKLSLDEFYKLNRSEGFGFEVKKRIMLGTFVLSTGYYGAYYSKAQQIRRLLVDKVNAIFEQHDILLMPTSPVTAMKIGESALDPIATYLADIYTVFANLTGIPGISLPLFSHSNNMPFGIQLMAKSGNELPLLTASQQLMSKH